MTEPKLNATLQASLAKVLQTVSSAKPTVPAKLDVLDVDSPLSAWKNYTIEFLNSPRGNISFVLEGEEDLDTSPSWLSIRLVLIVCVLIGIVLLALGSYSLHRRWCNNSNSPYDSQQLRYHKTTLML